MIKINLRFYEELNDFLPLDKQKVIFERTVEPRTSIKDVIESQGVPHTEVDLIMVNGESVDFSYQVHDGDTISVYPMFESIDISNLTKLRPKPLRETKFILDVHLGKLARLLRLLGFDVKYSNAYTDTNIANISQNEHRIALTRDVGLLKNNKITHGYWLRSTDPELQVIEIIKRFDLSDRFTPFTRCLTCNGMLEPIEKDKILEFIPTETQQYYQHFMQCQGCKKIYWEGSHYHKLTKIIEKMKNS